MTGRRPTEPSQTHAWQRIWRSIFPAPVRPRTETERKRFLRGNLPLHFRPPVVKEKTLAFSLSWGLGGMAVTLVLMQMATGLLLKFVYVPTPVDAYPSVQAIIGRIPFGRLVRNLHHWCANGLVVVLLLHMLRVFFTGAFHHARQFNWIIGLILFALVLAANLSGYLLPYDQLAYWAITVVSSMLGYVPAIGGSLQRILGSGGSEIGPRTLPFFYAMHTAVIPILLTGVMGFHFWRIRKAGGLVVPRKPSEPMETTPARVAVFPHLLVREAATALGLAAVMVVWAILIDVPLSDPANPGLSPNPVRAPWYFAGLQELLMHLHPVVAVSVIPPAAVIFLMSIPYMAYPRSSEGIWFVSAEGRRQSVAAFILAFTITPVSVLMDVLVVKTAPWAAGMSPVFRDGLLPLLLMSILAAVAWLILGRRYKATLNERVQFVFVFLAAALAVLTLVGTFFRGPFMKLIWQW
jgi:quinol-cytochrome oxidoreductase complex cytochrome b subunit